MHDGLELAVPQQLTRMLQDRLGESGCLPKKSTLYQYQLTVDLAHLMQSQETREQQIQQGLRFKRFLNTDSSPQARVDWLLIQLEETEASSLVGCIRAAHALISSHTTLKTIASQFAQASQQQQLIWHQR